MAGYNISPSICAHKLLFSECLLLDLFIDFSEGRQMGRLTACYCFDVFDFRHFCFPPVREWLFCLFLAKMWTGAERKVIDRATVTMELFGEVRGGGTIWDLGVWSYLTVGLLFGLTLPGISAHGFLRGGGWGKGLYSSKTIKANLSERETAIQREASGRG